MTHAVGVRLKPYRTPLRSSLERVSEPRVECSDTPREHARRSCVLRATCVEGTLGERAAGVHTSALRRIGVRSRGFRLREHPYRRRVDLSEHRVAMNASELAGKDAELAAVRERIDEAYGKIGAVVADIQRAVGPLGEGRGA